MVLVYGHGGLLLPAGFKGVFTTVGKGALVA
jgi:hypothetical protein